ncbi:MAG: SpoIID/LytB domain-containing protein [Vampirovibrio sp.]
MPLWIKWGSLCLGLLLLWCIGLPKLAQCNASMIKTTPQAPSNPTTSTIAVPLEHSADLIRIGLSNDAMTDVYHSRLILSADAPFFISLEKELPPVKHFQAGDALQWTLENGQLRLEVRYAGQSTFYPLTLNEMAQNAWIQPDASDSFLKVLNITRKGETPRYRGVLHVLASPQTPSATRLLLVNQLPMQDYLRAVVPNELPIRFGGEAVKAQAVAARNYAVRPREKKWFDFDLCDSQMCQAYYGQQTETPETDALLNATEGQVLLYGPDVALTLYSSSHGGVSTPYHHAFSDPLTQAFPAPALPYLKSVWDDPRTARAYPDLSNDTTFLAYLKDDTIASFDRKSPHFRWKEQWRFTEMSDAMKRFLPETLKQPSNARWIHPEGSILKEVGQVRGVDVLERDVSGKLMRVKIRTTTGAVTLTKELVIRSVLRAPQKRLLSASIAFEPWRDEDTQKIKGLTIYGTGFGHGVGMSQFGASGMNDLGFQYPEILSHYYPQTRIGSQPLQLNEQRSQVQQVHGIPKNRVLLHLQSLTGRGMSDPLTLQINQASLRMQPFKHKQKAFDVTPYFEESSLNTLHWPPMKNMRVWLSFEP